jgi:hypothetical protein
LIKLIYLQTGLGNLYIQDKFDTVLVLYCTKFYINYYMYELCELYETVLIVLTFQLCLQKLVFPTKRKYTYFIMMKNKSYFSD